MTTKIIDKISNYIVPLSAFHSLRENGFNPLECDVNMEIFSEIVNNSNPIIAVSLLRTFYLYYKILLTKHFIYPLKKESNSEDLKLILESEKTLWKEVNRTIRKLESKIQH